MRLFSSDTRRAALVAAMALFFLCGFTTVLNDVLIPFIQERMALAYAQVALIQVSFYLAYFLISPAAGWLFSDRDPCSGMRWGCLLGGLGACAIGLSSLTGLFTPILLSIFVLGSGIALIQVCCNLYVVSLPGSDSAAARLSLTQAFTNVGTVVAPYYGASLMLGRMDSSYPLLFPYLIVAAAWCCLLLGLKNLQGVQVASEKKASLREVFKEPALCFALLSIPLAVGVEVAVASFLVQYLKAQGFGLVFAGRLSMLFWAGFVCGRLLAHRLLRRWDALDLLIVHVLFGAALAWLASHSNGLLGAVSALSLGLCSSVLFPILYSVTLERVSINRAQVSGIVCMANLGGALLPLLFGVVADRIGVQAAFVVPFCTYLMLALLAARERLKFMLAARSKTSRRLDLDCR